MVQELKELAQKLVEIDDNSEAAREAIEMANRWQIQRIAPDSAKLALREKKLAMRRGIYLTPLEEFYRQLSQKINEQIGGRLPDDTCFGHLHSDYNNPDSSLLKEWHSYVNGLNDREKRAITLAVGSAHRLYQSLYGKIQLFGTDSLAEIRDRQLSELIGLRGIGQIRATFLKVAFDKN